MVGVVAYRTRHSISDMAEDFRSTIERFSRPIGEFSALENPPISKSWIAKRSQSLGSIGCRLRGRQQRELTRSKSEGDAQAPEGLRTWSCCIPSPPYHHQVLAIRPYNASKRMCRWRRTPRWVRERRAVGKQKSTKSGGKPRKHSHIFNGLRRLGRGYHVSPGVSPPISPGWVDFELALGFVLQMNMPERGGTFKREHVSCCSS